VTPPVYSSLEAFIAHRRALAAGRRPPGDPTGLSAAESDLLDAINALFDGLLPAERAALEASPDDRIDGAFSRRRERARSKLAAILTAAGWLR